MPQKVIFYDASLKRWRWIKRIGMAAALVGVVVSTLFFISLVFIPVFKPLASAVSPARHTTHPPLPSMSVHKKKLQQYLLKRIHADFQHEISRERSLQPGAIQQKTEKRKIVAAFYAVWQETGLHSLQANAGNLTHLMPEWVHLSPDAMGLVLNDWNPSVVPHNRDVEKVARQNNVAIIPILNNADQTSFDPHRVHILLSDMARQKKVIDSVRNWLVNNHYQGLNIDFENMEPGDVKRLPAFLYKMQKSFHTSGLILSADIESGGDRTTWGLIAGACDFVVLMSYDEHADGSTAGPIASMKWYRSLLHTAAKLIPPDKLVVGLGNYGYDWIEGTSHAESLTFQEALITASDNRPDEKPSEIIDFDPEALNPTYTYTDDKNKAHEVWMLDAVTAANQWTLAERMKVRGAALWVLGSEDPAVWNILNSNTLEHPIGSASLQHITFPYDVEFIGEGDILGVKSLPRQGHRVIEVDPKTDIFTDESYTSFPSAFVFQRDGLRHKMVALTFDDGPYEPYTSEILDELKEFNVKATFFVIGENLERHPDVIERIWKEGHEIGNHTYTHPNIGTISEKRATLEINATERALQSVLGRSTILFRAPYNADAEPTSAEEVWPVVFASKLGYITVGEYIDPQDWLLETDEPGTRRVKRTGEDIASEIISMVHTGHGNCVLLHDGGGDRHLTVDCLPTVITTLEREGYHFVTVSQLLSMTRDEVMPPVKSNDALIIDTDRIVFETNYVIEMALRTAFISAIILGTLRVLMITVLALIAYRKEKRMVFDSSFKPKVSVVIAAFNEGKVISNTIHAVAVSRYPLQEIIIVDDGSTDDTFAKAQICGNQYPLIKLIHQQNSGKATALNKGIALTTGEIVVCLDADTLFTPDTISFLVRRFIDTRVGAVAGNVKVGNRINILTYWQAIEYITSQNIDRRAYASLNAVTVIPGAVGAWRKEALLAVGGYVSDTLAEDMDLTWRIRKAGWRVDNESKAIGYTETPDTIHSLFTQRFRWTFGTIQCLWKHRSMLGHYGWFGGLMLPALWVFQVGFQIISPLIDLQIIWVLTTFVQSWFGRGLLNHDWQPFLHALNNLYFIGCMYAFFFVIELIGGVVAFRIEKEKMRLLWWLFWQRFVYRQLMYAVVIKSLKMAMHGLNIGWGKLDRKGTSTQRIQQ
ncbi:MAG: polysaccharide deacetylase family protein [Endomicrobiales bacterium]|jgi:cellulose synthase/poly-beta-1,6-N-acetylglucosamine synthase-like glycosyltransferase/spore germination protein YaaH/peptidoglycan/xylan/chitin deacetylase (PgdA/CDA1 family)